MGDGSLIGNDPLDASSLPQVGAHAFEQVSPKHLSISTAALAGFTALASALAVFATAFASSNTDGRQALYWGSSATALVLAVGIAGVVYLRARYRRLGYLLRQHDISVRRGVLVVSVQTVPFGRVQNVRVDRGPLDRAVGLASLTVTSAGGSLAVPGLPVEIAEALKETVVARAGLDQGETHNGER